MDGIDANAMLPPPDMGDLAPKKTPGRPPADPAKRALNDERYAQISAIMSELPPEAREFRFAVFRAKRNLDQKRSIRPLTKILLNTYNDLGLKDSGVMYEHLREKYGESRFLIEVHDAHNHRVERLPSWIVPDGDVSMALDEEDFEDEEDDDDRPRRRSGFRRARGRSRDEDEDDDRAANAGDLFHTANAVAMGNANQVGKTSTDMMSMLVMTMTQQSQAREADAQRQNEMRAEERRREEARSEERRREAQEERKRQDERDERNRSEERARERAEDSRRQDAHLAAINASNQRMQVMMGGITALVPVVIKMMEKKDDPMQAALLQRMLTPPQQDPVMAMLLKGVMDKTDRKDSAEMMMEQFITMSKLGAEMQGEQMKAMFQSTNEINKLVMQKAIDMMAETPQGQTPEGQDMIGKIAGIIGAATEMVKTLVPARAAPPIALPQPLQQRRQFPHTRPALPAPGQGQGQPQPPPAPGQPQPDAPTPPPAEGVPHGMEAVLGGLKAIHKKLYRSQEEYQHLLRLVIEQMPVDLRVHVIEGNEMGVFSLALPWVQRVPEFASWFEEGPTGEGENAVPATLEWVRTFVPQLTPSLIQVFGPLETQKAELAAALAGAGIVPKDEAQPEAAQVSEQPVQDEQSPEASAPVPADEKQVQEPAAAEPIPAEGVPSAAPLADAANESPV